MPKNNKNSKTPKKTIPPKIIPENKIFHIEKQKKQSKKMLKTKKIDLENQKNDYDNNHRHNQ